MNTIITPDTFRPTKYTVSGKVKTVGQAYDFLLDLFKILIL